MARCTTTSNSATTAKEASRNNLEGWHLMCSGAGSRRLICVGVCGVTNGIGAPACLRKIHLVKHRHPLVHLFPPGTHPTHVHSACSQCLQPTITFSLVVSAHSFATVLAPDHPHLPQMRSCVAALACVVFPAKQFAACIDGDTCKTHAVFPVVTKAGGSLPSPKNKRHHTWARQHGLGAIYSLVPLPVCAERAIMPKWPLTREH